MKVRCISSTVTSAQAGDLGYLDDSLPRFAITVGQSYLVLGLNFIGGTNWGQGLQFMLKDDFGNCAFVPMNLAEISDSRPSKHWRMKKVDSLGARLCPAAFDVDFFYDDLSEGDTGSRTIFEEVYKLLDGEHDDTKSTKI